MTTNREGVSKDFEFQQRELGIKESELQLRERELDLRTKQSGHVWFSNPISLGILAALIGFMGSVITTWVQGQSSLKLERTKSQSNLILEAIKTGDSKKAATNLAFFVQLGLIDDPDGKIARLAAKGETPVLPSPVARQPGPVITAVDEVQPLPSRDGITLRVHGLNLHEDAKVEFDGLEVEPRDIQIQKIPSAGDETSGVFLVTIRRRNVLWSGRHSVRMTSRDGQSAFIIFSVTEKPNVEKK
jgi:hypothetical protein